jgi:hypothetical protein
MATATAERPATRRGTPTEAPLVDATMVEPEVVLTDAGPVRPWKVKQPDGSWELVEFSLREIPPEERTVYWHPYGSGALMFFKAQQQNDRGHTPILQKEIWIDGKFAPRNEWEEHMTIEFLKTINGGADYARWTGYNHPDNEPGEPPHQWRCGTCSWLCGNWRAFSVHQSHLGHSGQRTD